MTLDFAQAQPPAIAGIASRMFRGDSDFPAMSDVANACFAADGIELRRTPQDMAHDYALFTECEPLRDVVLIEVNGVLVGYARVWRWTQADGLILHGQLGFVRPEWRRRGIGGYLQHWIEQRHREVAGEHAAQPHKHHVFLQSTEAARAALMQSFGYRPERYFFEMRHPDLKNIPDFQLPAGLELRPALPDHYRAIWDSHMAALQDHWGFSPPVPGDYEAWLKRKTFQPHRWQIAWDIADNSVVAQVRTWIDEDQNTNFERRLGYTEFITVARHWRRQGVARALVVQSLRTLAAAGMTESALGVDSENPSGATRVYEDCGFKVVKRNTVYHKAMLGLTPN